jgi:hypothetical protein
MEATPWTTSRDILFRTVDIIKSREAELKNMMCAETSCTAPFADFQIEFATSCLMEIASRISSMVGEISNMASSDSIPSTVRVHSALPLIIDGVIALP